MTRSRSERDTWQAHESSDVGPQLGSCYREGPSQHSLLNLPNHACLWGNAISFSLVKPAYPRCWMNLLKLLASSDTIGNSLHHQPCIIHSRLQTDTHGQIINTERKVHEAGQPALYAPPSPLLPLTQYSSKYPNGTPSHSPITGKLWRLCRAQGKISWRGCRWCRLMGRQDPPPVMRVVFPHRNTR